MKICMLGAGALGSSIGGVLALGGSKVFLVDRYEKHVDTINHKGLRLNDGKTDIMVPIKAYTRCENLPIVDLIIVLVKSAHTGDAIESVKTLIGDKTMVVSIQNGLGHEEILARAVGRERVLAAKTYMGGVFLGPGHVTYGANGKTTYIGELDGSITPRVQAVVDEFNRAGLTTQASDNITGVMWDKLLANVAAGALCAITRLNFDLLYELPEMEETALAAVAEGISVARAHNIRLCSHDPKYYWDMSAKGLPAAFKSSMLQSMEKGEMTEIDFINGSVVRWGERANIPTPVNKTLVACMKGVEYWIGHFGRISSDPIT